MSYLIKYFTAKIGLLKPVGNICHYFKNCVLLFVLFAATGLCIQSAIAAETQNIYSRGMDRALVAQQGAALYQDKSEGAGFSLGGSYFSGYGTGLDSSDAYIGKTHDGYNYDLAGQSRLYAVLLDGSYDFNHAGGYSRSFHPYLAGGVGLAITGMGRSLNASDTLDDFTGDIVPLFRVGGGVKYIMDKSWDFSLDYKAGFLGAGSSGFFASPLRENTERHAINVGLSYRF